MLKIENICPMSAYSIKTNMENWKKIQGFENYSVSDMGRVRNDKTSRMMKTPLSGHGYNQLNLVGSNGKKLWKVHRLVALCFIENPQNKPYVNHLDGNKQNNNVKNLEWSTESENIKHALENGLIDQNYLIQRAKRIGFKKGRILNDEQKENISKNVAGFKNPRCKITPENLNQIIEMNLSGFTQTYIAEKIGVHHSRISKILSGKTKFIL
jgi:hypothetical protein